MFSVLLASRRRDDGKVRGLAVLLSVLVLLAVGLAIAGLVIARSEAGGAVKALDALDPSVRVPRLSDPGTGAATGGTSLRDADADADEVVDAEEETDDRPMPEGEGAPPR